MVRPVGALELGRWGVDQIDVQKAAAIAHEGHDLPVELPNAVRRAEVVDGQGSDDGVEGAADIHRPRWRHEVGGDESHAVPVALEALLRVAQHGLGVVLGHDPRVGEPLQHDFGQRRVSGANVQDGDGLVFRKGDEARHQPKSVQAMGVLFGVALNPLSHIRFRMPVMVVMVRHWAVLASTHVDVDVGVREIDIEHTIEIPLDVREVVDELGVVGREHVGAGQPELSRGA